MYSIIQDLWFLFTFYMLIFYSFKSSCMNASDYQYIFVTGATGAIGEAIARNLAHDLKNYVVLVARNKNKAQNTAEDIRSKSGNPNVKYEIVDLSSRRDILSFADRWNLPLHVLVNNAATSPRSRVENENGIELQFATNVLGYLWMIQAFRDTLIQSAPSRIINVASYWAGGLDPKDLEFKRRRYDNNSAYRQSKQANRMLSAVLAEELNPHKVSVVSCHPGDVNSKLSNDLGFGGHESPDQGAMTPVWLAQLPFDELRTGKYYAHKSVESCSFSQDLKSARELYDICNGYV